MGKEAEQTTPIVTGIDIFSFQKSDTVAGPGGDEKKTDAAATPPETPAGDAAAAAPPEEGSAPAPESEKKQHRFKDHDEAERGYREAQSALTRAQQEAADLRKRIDAREAAEKSATAEATAAEAAKAMKQSVKAFTKESNKRALKAIEALDPDDPEHTDKVAEIWADFHAEVNEFAETERTKKSRLEAAPIKETADTKGDAHTKETPAADDAAKHTAANDPRKQRRDYVDAKARAAGIDPADELWIGVALATPTADAEGRPLPLDEQINLAIKRHNEKIAALRARAFAEVNQPMPGGGQPPRAPAAPSGPVSLDDAITRANERRRL